MRYRELCRILGVYLYFLSATILFHFGMALYFQSLADPATHPQPHATLAFAITFIACATLATLCRFLWGRRASGALFRREGLALVVVIWFVTGLFGALPFTLSGTLENPIDAYFEAISGLTTTGSSAMQAKSYGPSGEEIPITATFPGVPPIHYEFYGTVRPVIDPVTGATLATGVEAVGRAVLFWRSFLNWIGGMGIVMLFLAILPALGVGGKVLYQAEMPGLVKDALTPRIRDTASLLWKIYIGLTFLQVVLLTVTNHEMPLFDAITIAFSSLSTGGFSVRNSSIGYYESAATDWITILFMVLGSLNFVLFTYILKRKFRRIFEPEFNVYIVFLFVMTFILAFNLRGTQEALLTSQSEPATFNFMAALRYGCFQLVSLQTTTGFATANFDIWPYISQVLLLTVMFFGGMSGSTSGGIKMIRIVALVRLTIQKIENMFKPETVRALRIGPSEITSERGVTVLTFFFIVMGLTLIGTFLLVADGVDPETSLSVNACMLNNIGQAFRMGGPTQSFAFLSPFGKILSIFWMIFGRLEYFAVLLVFLPGFWKRS